MLKEPAPKPYQPYWSYFLLIINVLLVLWAFFTSSLQLPLWLQVSGRLHPVILHFPIVLWMLFVVTMLLKSGSTAIMQVRTPLLRLLLLLAAISSSVTAIAGIFLSAESGYDAHELLWHKWGGVALSVAGWLLVSFFHRFHWKGWPNTVTAILISVLVIVTGHQGASITHGSAFLLAPLQQNEEPEAVALEEALVFEHLVKPILKTKCINCHNTTKAKGELVMETEELLLKGGKNGSLWKVGEPGASLMIQRLHLPTADEEHMPPKGKLQLDEEEIQILEQWIATGASFKQRVADLPPDDALYSLVAGRFLAEKDWRTTIEPADEKLIRKLSNANRVIQPIAKGASALRVVFFNRQNFTSQHLAELSPLKEQITELNLNHMPVADADFDAINQFTNLQYLWLNNTPVEDKGLQKLTRLEKLNTLALNGTTVTIAGLQAAAKLPALDRVFIWNTPVASGELASLKNQAKNTNWIIGENNDSLILTLNPPLFDHEQTLISHAIPLKLRHPIHGVAIRYTLDGSEPDSVSGLLYTGQDSVRGSMAVKARAFKKGWAGSNKAEISFFHKDLTPDSVWLEIPPDPAYKGRGAFTLNDGIRGDLQFKSGKWLGFREQPMIVWVYFKEPTKIETITIGSLVSTNSYIMPPESVQVFGGATKNALNPIMKYTGEQPTANKADALTGYTLSLNSEPVHYVKVICLPVKSLPAWHPGKGQKGWIFADELYFSSGLEKGR